jgi:putative ABC transport system ATP-binding protein
MTFSINVGDPEESDIVNKFGVLAAPMPLALVVAPNGAVTGGFPAAVDEKLGGMLSPSSGQVFIDGQSLFDLKTDQRVYLRRTKIGFIFQTFNLIPYLSALENVEVPLFLKGMDPIGQNKKAKALLERVGLGDRLGHRPSELSVGQQQRVALARMLANDPTIILADEPTGNLDPETSQQVIAFLEEINREGKTVVFVTHDHQAARCAKRTLRLVEGRISA